MRQPPESIELGSVIGTVSSSGNDDIAVGHDVEAISPVKGGRWAKLSACAIADRRLTATYVRVLAYLAIHADRVGTAWPSQERIATALGIDRATVCRGIKRLHDLGYLDRYRKRTARGHFRNVYRLLYPSYVPVDANDA